MWPWCLRAAWRTLDAVWEFADFFNGLMAIPNLIALIALSPVIRRLSRDFFRDPDRVRPARGTDYRNLLTFRDEGGGGSPLDCLAHPGVNLLQPPPGVESRCA